MLHRLRRSDPGFDPERVITFSADPLTRRYPAERILDIERRLVDAVAVAEERHVRRNAPARSLVAVVQQRAERLTRVVTARRHEYLGVGRQLSATAPGQLRATAARAVVGGGVQLLDVARHRR